MSIASADAQVDVGPHERLVGLLGQWAELSGQRNAIDGRIVEIIADDFPGLLYRITHALHRCGLDLRTAIISTRIDQVLDVFYVRDLQGQKIMDPKQIQDIEAAVGAALSDWGAATEPCLAAPEHSSGGKVKTKIGQKEEV